MLQGVPLRNSLIFAELCIICKGQTLRIWKLLTFCEGYPLGCHRISWDSTLFARPPIRISVAFLTFRKGYPLGFHRTSWDSTLFARAPLIRISLAVLTCCKNIHRISWDSIRFARGCPLGFHWSSSHFARRVPLGISSKFIGFYTICKGAPLRISMHFFRFCTGPPIRVSLIPPDSTPFARGAA
jgi:hypothetical protein